MYVLISLVLLGLTTQRQVEASFSAQYQNALSTAHQFSAQPHLARATLEALIKQKQGIGEEVAKFMFHADPMHALKEYVLENQHDLHIGDLSAQCEQDLIFSVLSLVVQKQLWPLRFLDALFKPPAGLLDGNLNWFGAFDECTNIHINVTNNFGGSLTTVGTYCLVPIEGVLKLGLCLPASCGVDDIVSLVATINTFAHDNKYYNLTEALNITTNPAKIMCNNPNLPYTTYFKVAMGIAFVLVAINVVSTVYDIIKRLKAANFVTTGQTGSVLDVSASTSLFFGNNATSTAILPNMQGVTDDEAPLVSDINKPPPIIYAAPVIAPPSMSSKPVSTKTEEFLLSFAFFRNAAKVLTVEAPGTRGQNTLQALHGIRLLTMFWVILCHTMVLAFNEGIDNALPMLNMTQNFEFQVILHGFYAVDTFFVLGGFLLGYLTLRQLDKLDLAPGKRANKMLKFFGKFYLHRYLRLTPIYALCIIIYLGVSPYFMHGPVWQQYPDPHCVDNWWKNLLYIQNFVDKEEQCMGWAWYLAVDFQLFLISPIPLLAFYWKPLAGWITSIVILLLSSLMTSLTVMKYNLPAAPLSALVNNHTAIASTGNFIMDFEDRFFVKFFTMPWCRAAPWIIGLALGCALHRMPPSFSNARLQSGKVRALLGIFGWTISTGFALVLIYGMQPVYAGHYTLSTQVSALYWAGSRIAWGLSISWVIYACITGLFPGNFVRRFLSWDPFIPLSRLTYAAYLFHPIVMCTYFWTIRNPIHIMDMEIAYLFMASTVLVFASVFIIVAGVEVPLANLERLIFYRHNHHD